MGSPGGTSDCWRRLLFGDEDAQAENTRDPVAPARRSDATLHKVHSNHLEDGSQVHSFQTPLGELSSIVRNICQTPGGVPDAPTFQLLTKPNATQLRAFQLLESLAL